MGAKKYDVAITHAYGDKDSFANELALALKKEGARIWYSGFDLASNESIIESITHVLNDSRYGVMIIGPAYLHEHPAAELRALLAKNKHQRIIPVLHKLTAKQAGKHVPALSEGGTMSSSQGIGRVAGSILRTASVKKVKKRTGSKQGTEESAGVIVLGGNTNSKNIIGSVELGRKKRT